MAEPITVKITNLNSPIRTTKVSNLNSPIRTIKVSNKMGESAVTSVAGRVGDITLTQSDVAGLENVNNTSDLNKPVSNATQAALDNKSDIGHKHFLADISGAGTAAAADVGDFATFSHNHLVSDISGLGTAATLDASDFATFNQGVLADSAIQSIQPGSSGVMLN